MLTLTRNIAKKITAANTSAPLDLTMDGAEEYGMWKVPATPLDLLSNIQSAMGKNLLLTDFFYTDQNLRSFTGGNDIIRVGENREHVTRIEIRSFGAITKTNWDRSRDEGAIAIFCRKEAMPGEDVNARIILWIRNEDERVSYRNMEKLFIQQWQNPTARIGEICPPSLHKNGNTEMKFSICSGDIKQIISLLFSPRANLEMASFIEIRHIDGAP